MEEATPYPMVAANVMGYALPSCAKSNAFQHSNAQGEQSISAR